ncbi:MAG: hypothetical protein ACTSSE_15435 [Candidatus Thorarchaeota archaeon]
MQVAPTLDIALVGIPGILLGLLVGYIIGGMPIFRLIDRIGLGIILSGAGGLVLSFVIGSFFAIGPLEIMFVVLAFSGGYFLGLFLNWKPPDKTKRKQHIIYEPDDDDAFDREIEEALGGKK